MNGRKTQELGLKIAVYAVCIISSLAILLPFLFLLTNGLRDDTAIYDARPELLPPSAKSVSVVMDYTALKGANPQVLLEKMEWDAAAAIFAIPAKLNEGYYIYEVRVYGVIDGKTVFYTRGQKARCTLEIKFGVINSKGIINKTVLQSDDKYKKVIEAFGYKFNRDGISDKYDAGDLSKNSWDSSIKEVLIPDYGLNGKIKGTTVSANNLLMLENFRYYFELPSYMYANNDPVVAKFSFWVFIKNTVIVLLWAMLTQTALCSLTAYPLSKLLKKRTADILILFFLATMMAPFICILVPQLIMFKGMGFYNNYAALLVPYLYPFPFFIFLYKGFFDQLPSSLFDAARIDGAGELRIYAQIVLPLSKAIISVVAVNVFLANWNDFMWAWLVTEKPSMWTLNVALYNISRATGIIPVMQNFLMGLSFVTIIPVILLTVLFSEQIRRSVVGSAIKG